jgi:hypothetical protein
VRPRKRERDLLDELAAGRVVSQRVEGDGLPDHTAVAKNQVPRRVPNDERLACVDAREREDCSLDASGLRLMEQAVPLATNEAPVSRRVQTSLKL